MGNGGLNSTSTVRKTSLKIGLGSWRGKNSEWATGKEINDRFYSLSWSTVEKQRLIVAHLLLLAPIFIFITEIDQPFLNLTDKSRRCTTIIEACHITLSTISTSFGDLLAIDMLRGISCLVVSVSIAGFFFFLLPPLLLEDEFPYWNCAMRNLCTLSSTIESIL